METNSFGSELAYELVPSTNEQILAIDNELADLYN